MTWYITCGNDINISNCKSLMWSLNSLFNIVYYLLVTFILSNYVFILFVKNWKGLTEKYLKRPGSAKKKAFYWEKRRKNSEGEHPGSLFVTLFYFSDNR